jgi:hypothetical protein
MTNNINNQPNSANNKGGRPVQEEKKDKIISIRVDNRTNAVLEELRISMGYKSLSAFIIDMVLAEAKKFKKYTPFNPDIERLFCDLEESLKYARSLESRVAYILEKDIVDDFTYEIMHFKNFVAKKAEALLYLVRDEHFKQK